MLIHTCPLIFTPFYEIAEQIPNRRFVVIGAEAFKGCDGITSVWLPDGLFKIGDSAFSGCAELESVVLPDSLLEIPPECFRGCRALSTVVFPATLSRIGEYAFKGCQAINELEFPVTLTAIDGGAFSGCAGIEQLELPTALQKLGGSAFERCAGLRTLSIPCGKLHTICRRAFYSCTALEHLSLPPDLREIKAQAFSYCQAPAELLLPDTLVSIGGSAFGSVCKLRRLVLPGSLRHLGVLAFADCRELEVLVMAGRIDFQVAERPDIYTAPFGLQFSGCRNLRVVSAASETVLALPVDAFDRCPNSARARLKNSPETLKRQLDAFRSPGAHCRLQLDYYWTARTNHRSSPLAKRTVWNVMLVFVRLQLGSPDGHGSLPDDLQPSMPPELCELILTFVRRCELSFSGNPVE